MKTGTGKLIIICAPSGTGKTTIVRAILPRFDQLEFSVSACSRPPRQGEEDGRDYYFMSADTFREAIDNDEFLEWEEVYPGSYYGTLRSEVERIWSKGRHVIFDVDVVGGLNIKKQYPDNSLAIFIQPPSIEELRNRLMNRGTENPESLQKRLDKAGYELGLAKEFDIQIVNDQLDEAVEQTYAAISDFLT